MGDAQGWVRGFGGTLAAAVLLACGQTDKEPDGTASGFGTSSGATGASEGTGSTTKASGGEEDTGPGETGTTAAEDATGGSLFDVGLAPDAGLLQKARHLSSIPQ